jgi:septal ring factor EnvC (AmiA/AmiB activator)
VRRRLVAGLTSQFERELDHSVQRINEAIAPYTRFVRAEGERLRVLQKELKELEKSIELLKTQTEQL